MRFKVEKLHQLKLIETKNPETVSEYVGYLFCFFRPLRVIVSLLPGATVLLMSLLKNCSIFLFIFILTEIAVDANLKRSH
jgi:hypothetical protein